jgi:hypothetical protein
MPRARSKPFTPRQARTIATAYAKGATVADLIRRFGTSRYHVERALFDAGIDRRPVSQRRPPAEAPRIRELAARGLSLRAIAADVGRCHRFVWLVLNRPTV